MRNGGASRGNRALALRQGAGMDLTPFSSPIRPALAGRRGAVAAAHPLAVAAGQEVLARGGSAADAVIAGQAALAVVAPDACGLGGDAFVLLHRPGRAPVAVNGAGPAPAGATGPAATGGASVAVPGLVAAWAELHRMAGRLPLPQVLAPAVAMAREGIVPDAALLAARAAQAGRLAAGGAAGWGLMAAGPGEAWVQPALAGVLEAIGTLGTFPEAMAEAIAGAVRRHGGAMTAEDLAAPAAQVLPALSLRFAGGTLHVQPPMSQGVLLALAADGFAAGGFSAGDALDHLGVELTEAAFTLRADAAEGLALRGRMPAVDPARAGHRGGPRAYLHTAAVCAADAAGQVVASLVSVFDDFGSGVFVPEGGFCLNNRIGGFTGGANAFRPGARPVHTLAPMLFDDGEVTGLATPGADGQVQTLLQILLRWRVAGQALDAAVAAPRWRSEDGRLLVEAGHPARGDLVARGHRVTDLPAGEMRFGAVAAAGMRGARPFALADWRRLTWAGVA